LQKKKKNFAQLEDYHIQQIWVAQDIRDFLMVRSLNQLPNSWAEGDLQFHV
jgi:hypothetical protein